MTDLTPHKRETSDTGQALMYQSPDSARSQPPPRPSTAPRVASPIATLQKQPCPRVVTAALWVWICSTLVAMSAAAITLTQFDRAHDALVSIARKQSPTADYATLNRVATVSIVVLIGAGVLLALLQLALAAAARAGRNWARLTLVVSAGLGVFYCLLLLGGANSTMLGSLVTATRAVLLLYIALVPIAVALLFFPGAKPWFRRREVIGASGRRS